MLFGQRLDKDKVPREQSDKREHCPEAQEGPYLGYQTVKITKGELYFQTCKILLI